MDSITKSYIQQLKSTGYHTFKQCKNEWNKEECLSAIKKYMMDNNASYPDSTANQQLKHKFDMIKGSNAIDGRFNSDTLHNIIYTILLLSNYDNIFIPYQYFIHDKIMNDKMIAKYNNIITSYTDIMIKELLNIYLTILYESVPQLILWKSKYRYHINKDVTFHLDKCLYNDKIRYVYMKITMIVSDSGTHANALLLDKKTGIMERFEPYGNVPYLDKDELDNTIKKTIGSHVNKYLQQNGKKLTYLAPKDYMDNISFQIISRDSDTEMKKLGDPTGYCLAWIYWYIEMRISNPDMHPKELIKHAMDNIIENKEGKYNFIDFIRNYANKLDKEKNKLLVNAGVKKKYLYNLVFKNSDYEKIVTHINKLFENMINKF